MAAVRDVYFHASLTAAFLLFMEKAMPYEIKNKCVYKQDEAEPIKCHATEEEAQAHMAALYAAESEASKAGARHNKNDMQGVQTMHDMAVKLGATCEGHEEEYKAPVKATGLDGMYTEYNTPELAIKIAGEMELDVCYLPYGGPKNGRDTDGQYFSKATKDWAHKYTHPLALYYHGYQAQGKPQEQPFEIGETGKRWEDSTGRWIKIKLNPSIPEAVKTWDDAKAGKARASSGSINHLVRVEADGHITNWPVVEISVFDTSDGKSPANSYALAKPAAKAHGFDVEDGADDVQEMAQVAAAIAISIYKSQH